MGESLSVDDAKEAYWQSYYARKSQGGVPLPSQFCVFVAGELGEPMRVLDIGCGSGRDSMFFASHGHVVTGIDGAASAIEGCSDLAKKLNLNASFVCATVEDAALVDNLRRAEDQPERTLVYARFFLHAITMKEEERFLDLASRVTRSGDCMAVEFRTNRDVAQSKVTDSHYRRFIDPVQFLARVLSHGFDAEYFVDGFGFAKYKSDDAHVARFIFRRI